MKEKHKYICEVCNAEFNDYEQAKEHEEQCSIKETPVRAIVLSDDFTVMDYTKAQYWKNPNGKDRINLMPQKYDSSCNFFYPLSHFNLDEIKISDGSLIIYTLNLDNNYLEECLRKMIDYKIKDLHEMEKSIESKIKQFEKSKEDLLKNKINYKENLLIEYMD